MSVGTAELENAVFEPPFPIPKSWTWCRLGNVIEAINGLAFKPTDWKDSGLPIVRIQNLNDSSASFNFTDRQIPDSVHLYGGELLFAWSGTPGTSFGAHIWQYREAALNQHIFKLVFSEDLFDKRYLKIALNNLVERFIEQAHGGVGLAHITRKVFDDIAIPIPPMREQRHIVEQYENIATLCECVDRNYSELQSLSVVLKSHILDIAIRGDLVPQDLADEPASVLLDRIRITADKPPCPKKRKTQKDTIGDVLDAPFPIPESWAWTTLGDVAELVLGGTPDTHDSKCWCGDIPWLTPGEMSAIKGKYVSDTRRKLTQTGLEKGSRMFPSRSVVLSTRAPIGYLFINTIPMCTNQGCKTIVPKCGVLAEYLYYNLLGRVPELQSLGTGTTFKELSSGKLASLPLSLPPLAEQLRIVTKVDELFATIDEMLG